MGARARSGSDGRWRARTDADRGARVHYRGALVQQVSTSIVSHWGAPLYLRPLSHRMGYGHGDGPLSASQIGAFKAEGYLILRGFLPLEDVDGWRESFWAHIQAQFPGFVPEDDRSWPDTKVIPGGFSVPFGAHPKMQAVVAQLGAGKLAGGGGGVLVNWPQGDAPADTEEALKSWSPSAQGHVDGYGPGGWSGGFTLAATTYLENVEPGGGEWHLLRKEQLGRGFSIAPTSVLTSNVDVPVCITFCLKGALPSGRAPIGRCIGFSESDRNSSTALSTSFLNGATEAGRSCTIGKSTTTVSMLAKPQSSSAGRVTVRFRADLVTSGRRLPPFCFLPSLVRAAAAGHFSDCSFVCDYM